MHCQNYLENLKDLLKIRHFDFRFNKPKQIMHRHIEKCNYIINKLDYLILQVVISDTFHHFMCFSKENCWKGLSMIRTMT